MKRYSILLILVCSGCARFSTHQTDISDETTGKREITTKASASTFFSAKSSLAQWKATQTDKSQGATVGGLDQSGGQTNQVSDIVRAVVEGAIIGASKAAKP